MTRDLNLEEILAEIGMDITPELEKRLKGEEHIIRIPNKVEKKLAYASQKDLLGIHPDIDVAKELVFLTVSSLSDTWCKSFMTSDHREKLGYKRLNSTILARKIQCSGKVSSKYKRALELLIKLKIVETGWDYSDLHMRSKEYRLSPWYFSKGITSYNVRTSTVLKKCSPVYRENFKRAITTNIGINSLVMRDRVSFPESSEVEKHLLQAVKNKFKNKKGKRLVKLGKHSKAEYPELHFVYVEDYLKRYEYLRDHMLLPIVSANLAKERIIDSFNMMPSLIRELFTINGESFVEIDFACLHPNIVQKLYGAEKPEPITHELVAQRLFDIFQEDDNFPQKRKEVKLEHLSFFNKDWNGMQRSSLFKYYDSREPMMINRMGIEKEKYGYNITAKRLFEAETLLMDDIVGRLNKQGIYVLYVFDALYALEKDRETVRKFMNEVAAAHGILTNAA